MPATRRHKSSCIQWLSPTEMAEIIDTRSRAVLSISGESFMRKRAQRKYAKLDADACPGIVELALLAPSTKKGARSIAGKVSKRSR